MEVKLDVPVFTKDEGIRFNWEVGFEIEAKMKDGIIYITANKAGLVSLANHLLNLAQDDVPLGYHVHFDEYNSLEEGSSEVVIQKQ